MPTAARRPKTTRAAMQEKAQARIEDALWLISWRVHPDEVARRVGVSRDYLMLQLRDQGHPDAHEYLRYQSGPKPK